MPEIESVFEPLPAQQAFFDSKAKVLGYGGAMGGGKTRCLCEWAFENCLNYPGLACVIARQSHVSIVDSTRKIMVQQVIPPELLNMSRVVSSGGFDFIKLPNESELHFIGLDDPGRQFSTETGLAVFDEAHQVQEESVLLLKTRMRQRCPECRKRNEKECSHYPQRIALGFNPENPGHWLHKWFIDGATMELWPDGKYKGWKKAELYATDGDRKIGDCEFIFSKATDNTYLSEQYILEDLGGLPPRLRDRYLEGKWIYTSGNLFFDSAALEYYEEEMKPPWRVGVTSGDPKGKNNSDRPRLRAAKEGFWWVWKAPVQEPEKSNQKVKGHRYVMAVDVSSGTSNDYSAIQVIDIEEFEQVAEYQGLIDPDLLAIEAARVGYIYNEALIAPEITGGWGASIIRKLEQLQYRRLYVRRVEDRIAKKYTDYLGWSTTHASRAFMLDKLEEVLRERELKLYSARCLSELASFVWPGDKGTGPFKGIPQAQPGANDDLVMALAIAVAVVVKQPKELRKQKRMYFEPYFEATGY